ncbi:MAG TPA: hypothetical protein VK919_07870 [Solirubrobacterales bacterium]|nr:hypothetical protein [Solirubrobacterales bacterium]
MPQTRKRRRKKRRGTQSGRIDTRGRRGRPRSRAEARSQAKRRSQDRRDRAPSWSSAITRAVVGAIIFFALLMLLFRYELQTALLLSALMMVLYVPLGYQLDRFFWRRRQRMLQRRRQAEPER